MNPYNNFGPYGIPMMGFPFPPFPGRRRTRIPVLDQHGIYEVCTTGMAEVTGAEYDTVDYGINPDVWRALPCECVIIWKVRHPVSQNGASLPVNIIVPTSGKTTVSNSSNNGSSMSTTSTGTKIPVVDNKSTQVEGHDVTVPIGNSTGGDTQQLGNTTEHWVYINKSAGVFRMMGVIAQNSPARSTPTTPTTPTTPDSGSGENGGGGNTPAV